MVLDTNVFVGAGFNESSASRDIIRRVEEGALRLVWSGATRRETERILRQIPPLDWNRFAALFRDEDRHDDALDASRHTCLSGAMDRVFLALAEAVGAPLVTSDAELLAARGRAAVPVLSPGEYLGRQANDSGPPNVADS